MDEAEFKRAEFDAEIRVAEADLKLRVMKEANRQGFADPADAFKLVDLTAIDESPETVRDEVKRLANNKPFLIAGRTKPPPSPGVGGRPLRARKPMTANEAWVAMLRSAIRR